MAEENIKTCRYCGEKVKPAAKVCPHCRQWLSVFSFRNLSFLIVVTWFWIFFLLISLVVHLHATFGPGIDFSPYRNQVSVVESGMYFRTNATHAPLVSVIAVVTNRTDIAWDGIHFEARFFDKTGTLIDVGRGDYYDTLYPKTDGAIRIDASMLHPVTSYDSYKIYIGSAHDVSSRF